MYPYNDKGNYDDVFKITYTNCLELMGCENPSLEIVTRTELERRDMKTLNIENMYQNHLNLVKNVSAKSKLYSQAYIDSVNRLLDKKISNDELSNFLFGYGQDEQELACKPLSKLMQELMPKAIVDNINSSDF